MKKLLLSLGAIAIGLMLFAGGIFAYQQLKFTGTEQAEQTNNNSSEMLQIIKDLSADKITAEEAEKQLLEQQKATIEELTAAQARVNELEDMNPPGLVKQIKELESTNLQLSEDKKQLENNNTQLSEDKKQLENNNTQLHDENEQLKKDKAQLTTDLNAKEKEIGEKNQAYNKLQEERNGLQTEIDNLTAQLNEAKSDKDEIARLEAELIKANEAMAAVNEQSNADVEEARTYK